MKPEDLAGLGIISTFILFFVLEALRPGREYPKLRFWRARAIVQFVLIMLVASSVPFILPVPWMEKHRLFDGSRLGTVGGVAVGYLVVSFVNYVWHRSTHRFDFLWRSFHQLHHAPQRMDLAGSTVFHPLDVLVYAMLSVVVTTFILGLNPVATAVTAFVGQFYGFFQHVNARTPRWLGYIIQRPEAHFIHHQRDVHAFNYADFPLWDILFGTFRNPSEFGREEAGFASPTDSMYVKMLTFRDVSDHVGTRDISGKPQSPP